MPQNAETIQAVSEALAAHEKELLAMRREQAVRVMEVFFGPFTDEDRATLRKGLDLFIENAQVTEGTEKVLETFTAVEATVADLMRQ